MAVQAANNPMLCNRVLDQVRDQVRVQVLNRRHDGKDFQLNKQIGNAATYFIDRHRAGPLAGKPAFIEAVGKQVAPSTIAGPTPPEPQGAQSGQGRSLTYVELAARTDQMADLYQRHKIRVEERALMLVLDCIEFPIIFWGSLKAGVIPVPLNTLLSADVYDAIFRDSRARALFVSETLLPVVQPILKDNPFLKTIFVVADGHPVRYLSFAQELAKSKPRPVIETTADASAFWLYSSGSTGQPKGVRHVHSSLRATAETYGAKVLGIKEQDVVYSVAKMFFAYGLGNAMTFPLAVGATTVLFAGRPTPQSVGAVMAQFKPTLFFGVPTLFAALLASFKDGTIPPGFERVRQSVSAGEALPRDIGTRWQALIGSSILDGVGSTELLHIFLSNAPGDVDYGTSGIAVPGYQLRLVDENSADVAAGEIGELLVDGASAASDYWNQRDKSRNTFAGRWTRTGDKYERRTDGRYIYCGRTDDMFKVSGIWLSPFEVEQAIASHPDVLEAAVVAARDDDGLEKPKAFVVLNTGAWNSADDEARSQALCIELKSHVKDKIGKWKYPRWIEFVDDLPKTATGKVQRFKLRAPSGGI